LSAHQYPKTVGQLVPDGPAAAAARAALGLDTAATTAATAYATASHTHTTSDITSGMLGVARGGTGLGTIASGKLLYTSADDTLAPLTLGTNLSITSDTLNAAGGGGGLAVGGAVSGGGANRLLYEDGSSNLAASANLTYDGSNLTANGLQAGADGQAMGSSASGRFSILAYGISSTGTVYPGEFNWSPGSGAVNIQNSYLSLGSTTMLRWSAGDPHSVPCDVALVRDSTGVLKVTDGSSGFGDHKTRVTFIRKNTAPADSELVAGELAFWFDPTDGAAKLMVKAKTSNGTVVTNATNLA
jgi:hypothetical protein